MSPIRPDDMHAKGTENGKSFTYMSRKEYHDAAESPGYKAGYKAEYITEKNAKSITFLRNTAESAEREREREREFVRPETEFVRPEKEFVRPETVKSFTFIQDDAASPGESGKVIPVLGFIV
jgi:hypothetical protein